MRLVDTVVASLSVLPKRRPRESEFPQRAYRRDSEVVQLLQLMPVALLVADRHGCIVSANGAATSLFGYADEEVVGMRMDRLFPDLGSQAAEAQDAPDPGKVLTLASPRDRPARRKDGREFPVELAAIPLPGGGEAETLMVVTDRTDHYALRRSREQLAHLTRISTLGEFSGSLAHEVKQPLTAILSNAQAAQRFLAEEPVNLAELREIMDDLVSDSHRATAVLGKLRVLVRRNEFQPARLDLAQVLGDAALLVRSAAVTRRIRVQWDTGADLPAIHGDHVQLQQVMLNLLLNAFEAMDATPAEDRVVEIDAQPDETGMIRVAVRDRGRGLPKDTTEMMFMPYFTSKPEGLGLGLSISRSIVEMHGGRIWAENNAGPGATFYFTLPAVRAASSESSSRQP